jgi:hypothetical protein
MATTQRRVMVLVRLSLGAGVLYLLGPVVGCWYNEYRFNRYVHVQVDVPSCAAELSETVSGPCRFIFSFDGELQPKAIRFEGSGLRYSYDTDKRTYNVSGLGRVINGSNVIELAASKVLFNGQLLPRATQPVLCFAKRDGGLVSGYCELRW